MLLVDLSNVNGPVDWHAIRRAGITGAFLKATEGVSFDDELFHLHRRQAAAVGIRAGAYHFARPDHNGPIAEARHFAKVVGRIGARELRPVLDLETHADEDLAAWARQWNHTVRRLLDVGPLFYTYPAFAAGLNLRTPIGYGLWLASYGRDDGREHPYTIPRPWRAAVAHQFTSRARLAGAAGYVDLSSAPRLAPLLAHPLRGRLPKGL